MIPLRNLWTRRWVRTATYFLITPVTATFLLFTWVNWQGNREIDTALAKLKSEGETIDFRAITPDAVPNQQNFCATPALLDIALAVEDDAEKGAPAEKRRTVAKLKLPAEKRPKAQPVHAGQHLDLPAYAKAIKASQVGTRNEPAEMDKTQAAKVVLEWMAPSQPLLDEISSVTGRPHAQWTPNWKQRELPANLFTVALPHVATIQSFGTLSVRAAALQQLGQTPAAFESLLILCRVTEANFNDPFLIGFLVGASSLGQVAIGVWELCSSQAGTVQEYERMEAALRKIDVRASLLMAYRSELSACASSLLYYRTNSAQIAKDFNGAGAAAPGWLSRFAPSGILQSAAAKIIELEFRYLVKPAKSRDWRAILESASGLEQEMQSMRGKSFFSPPNQLVLMAVPAAANISSRAAYAEVVWGQSILACALERHRIAQGGYPAALSELRFANDAAQPLDPFSGKPYGYRKLPDGRYLLYSVGIDLKDDGGQRGTGKEQPGDRNYKGDLVWDYPAEK